MTDLVVKQLAIYPVKSMAGIIVEDAQVDAFGLENDRRWMVIDEAGQFITQREMPSLCLVKATRVEKSMVFTAPGMSEFSVSVSATTNRIKVSIWNDVCSAFDAGDSAARWISQYLKSECRLVRFPDDEVRQIDLNYAKPGEKVAFSDGFPLLLTTSESLADLNEKLQQPITMSRFRPNIVIAGATPFAEDQWLRLRVGEVVFRVVKPCSRCGIPNIDPKTGQRESEPMTTLTRYRRRGNKVYFGQNIIAENEGHLSTGMSVEILERQS